MSCILSTLGVPRDWFPSWVRPNTKTAFAGISISILKIIGRETVLSLYLNPYTGKTASLYWDSTTTPPHTPHPGPVSYLEYRDTVTVSKLGKLFTIPTYNLINFELYGNFIFTGPLFEIKLHLLNTANLWISKLPGSFEIHWLRQCLVNFSGLAGIINATSHKTEPIFTGLGHSKLL